MLDIITCAATHGYGPLLSQESSIHGQYYTAVNNYKKHFLREPVGTWVPECAYRPAYKWKNPLTNGKEYFRPGVEYFLSRNNLKYFFIDTPLLMGTTVSQSQGSSEQSTALQQIYDQFKKQTKVSKKPGGLYHFGTLFSLFQRSPKPRCFLYTRREHWDLGVEWDLWLPW